MEKVAIVCSLQECMEKLENGEFCYCNQIPEEHFNNIEVVKIARKLGLRKTGRRGYDIIHDHFFVEETHKKLDYIGEPCEVESTSYFCDFQSYFEFLQGDIYDNACYYLFDFTHQIINQFNVDVSRIAAKYVPEYTMNDCFPEATQLEIDEYKEIEKRKTIIKKWIKKFNAAKTYEELQDVIKKHKNSTDTTKERFYILNYVNYHKENSFDVIMKYLCLNGNAELYGVEACVLYGVERVASAYNYQVGCDTTKRRYNKRVKEFVKAVAENGLTINTRKGFDEKTHFYYIFNTIKARPFFPFDLHVYFETFEEFIKAVNGDLTNCDLSKAIFLKEDFSKYITDETTVLPQHSYTNLKKVVSKKYDKYINRFVVRVSWHDDKNTEVCVRNNEFKYFFEFAAFLRNDLSGADLLFCHGLKNVRDLSQYNLTEAKLQSVILERIGGKISKSSLIQSTPSNFALVSSNERETSAIFDLIRESDFGEYHEGERQVDYITDIHLLHRLHNAKCVTENDCICVIQEVIDAILTGYISNFILIGGDVASDFSVFSLFVRLLRQSLDQRNKVFCTIIFVLGNHELWSFPGEKLDDIVKKYRDLLAEHNMYLLHNEVIYEEDFFEMSYITQQDLELFDKDDIRKKLQKARLIIFGGIGFSGHNDYFNAENGIYRDSLSRKEEIIESEKFDELYEKVCSCLEDRKVIILTHMPLEDWHKDQMYKTDFVYVSGHNHKNTFYDDGTTRIYADNQVGYNCERLGLKRLYIDYGYDWFTDYADGIYQITREDYNNFYRGMNIRMTFNRDFDKLYMLKKNKCYLFIHQTAAGKLQILHGGSFKSLSSRKLEYYYDNMDEEIAYFKEPLMKYQAVQTKVSDVAKKFGGTGKIHGAIVDIDFFNHIYVNPWSGKLTAYFALDMVQKLVYPSIPALLEKELPSMYEKYMKLLEGKEENALILKQDNTVQMSEPVMYYDTDIYEASREIKKWQRLNKNILTTWQDWILSEKTSTQKKKLKGK